MKSKTKFICRQIMAYICVIALLITQNSVSVLSVGETNKTELDKTEAIINALFAERAYPTMEYNGSCNGEVEFKNYRLDNVADNHDVKLFADATFMSKNVEDEQVGITVSNFKLKGDDSDKYYLADEYTNGTIQITVAKGEILPKTITCTPKDNRHYIGKTEADITQGYAINDDDIIGDDTITVKDGLKWRIVEISDGNYVYQVSDNNTDVTNDIPTDNKNYKVEAGLPIMEEIPTVSAVVTLEDSTDSKARISYDENLGIFANRSVVVSLSINAIATENELKFRFYSNDTELIGEEVAVLDGDKYTAEFPIELSDTKVDRVIEDFECKVTIDEEILLNTPINLTLKSATGEVIGESNKLTLDDEAPVPVENNITVAYDNKNKKVTASAEFSDNLSGIKQIEYKLEGQENFTPVTNFSFTKTFNYNELTDTDGNGKYELYLNVTDYAGNVYTNDEVDKFYCDSNSGKDTLPPVINDVIISALDENDNGLELKNVLKNKATGNYSKETIKLEIKAHDVSEGSFKAGINRIVLLNDKGENTGISPKTVLNDAINDIYVFELKNDCVIENLKIQLIDNNGYVSTETEDEPSYLLKDLLVKYDHPPAFKWHELKTNNWIIDTKAPKITPYYGSEVVTKNNKKYYNSENIKQNAKFTISVAEINGLSSFEVRQLYKGETTPIATNLEDTNKDGKITHSINIKDLPTGEYTYIVNATDNAGNSAVEQKYTFYVEQEPPTGTVTVVEPTAPTDSTEPTEKVVTEIDGKNWTTETDANGEYRTIVFGVAPTSTGSEIETVVFTVVGENETTQPYIFYGPEGETIKHSVKIAETKYSSENTYTVSAKITTVAGNTYETEKYVLHIDTQDPSIEEFTVKKYDSSAEEILDILTFGIFSNKQMRLSVTVKDGAKDAGISNVKLNCPTPQDPIEIDGDKYTFKLPVEDNASIFSGNISITATDKLGKTTTKFPVKTTVATEENIVDSYFAMIENIPPTAKFEFVNENSHKWYNKNEYIKLTVKDESSESLNSGIREVKVVVTAGGSSYEITEDKDGKALLTYDYTKMQSDKITEATYMFSIDDIADELKKYSNEKYTIECVVVDNAGNDGSDTKEYGRDITSPTVQSFSFEPITENGTETTTELTTESATGPDGQQIEYGYFFKNAGDYAGCEAIKVIATVDDTKDKNGNTVLPSGFDKVVFNLDPVEDIVEEPANPIGIEEATAPVKSGKVEAKVFYNEEAECYQAECIIPKNFKGKIYAQAFDIVGNSSEQKTSKGIALDDKEPDVAIDNANEESAKEDDSNNQLYTGQVQFDVTISDKKVSINKDSGEITDKDLVKGAGLKSITYVKHLGLPNVEENSSDNIVKRTATIKYNLENGLGYKVGDTISVVKENGDIDTDAGSWVITEMDGNLVTEVKQTFTFTDEGKGAYISFSVTDNSNNTNDVSSDKITIDKTPPMVNELAYECITKNNETTEEEKTYGTIELIDNNNEELGYGYFLKNKPDSTEVKLIATVDDTSGNKQISSGFDKVVFKLVLLDTDGVSEETLTNDGFIENSETKYYEKQVIVLNSDDNFYKASEDGPYKVECQMPNYFKGKIFVKAVDNTGESSNEKTSKALVVDGDSPTITLGELPTKNQKKDDAGNLLYKNTVNFKVSISDSKSGLKKITYKKNLGLPETDENESNNIVERTAIIDYNSQYGLGSLISVVDGNGNIVADEKWKVTEMDNNLVTAVEQIFTFSKDGKGMYMIFNATDNSNNVTDESNTSVNTIKTKTFTIDTLAPTVAGFDFDKNTVDGQPKEKEIFKVTDDIKKQKNIKYGYFFENTFDDEINLIASVYDNKNGNGDIAISSGINSVIFTLVLSNTEKNKEENKDFTYNQKEKWYEKKVTVYNTGDNFSYDSKNDCYKVKCPIPNDFKGQIFVKVMDNADTYSVEKTSNAIVVENTPPVVSIGNLPDNISKHDSSKKIVDDAKNKLYTGTVSFEVKISDEKSGLKNICYKKNFGLPDTEENTGKNTVEKNLTIYYTSDYKVGDDIKFVDEDGNVTKESSGWKITKMDANLVTEVSQVFTFKDNGKGIHMNFNATDNSNTTAKDSQTETFTIDKIAPTVEKFEFKPVTEDNIAEAEKFIEELEYGFYFKKEFNAVVSVDDKAPSSGLAKVRFRLVSYDNGEIVSTEVKERTVDDKKAVCKIPSGFKGQIYATAIDMAEVESVEQTPQAFVVDEIPPVVTIAPLKDNQSKVDMAGNKLYTGEVTFRVTISDEKAGLRELVYSKTSENDSFNDVVTTIDNISGYNENDIIGNGWQITKMDKNLVTEVSREFIFNKDDNNIVMNFSATDRSKNTCKVKQSEAFTIDTITPKVTITNSAEPINDMYYKDSTTFVITVTERNFDPAKMLDEITPSFTNAQVKADFATSANNSNVHIATLVFPEGDYKFAFSGTDCAGHKAEITTNKNDQPTTRFFTSFNVDATAPAVTTNFAEFGDVNDTQIYFNTSKTATIEVVEHNFFEYDMNISVKSKMSGTPHTADGEGWYDTGFASNWVHNGDKHTLQIKFDKDGVYKISISPTDRAGNKAPNISSAIYEIDTTTPELYSRNEKLASEKGFVKSPYYMIYDEKDKKNNKPAPSIQFDDLNFDRIEIEAVIYRPEYKNGKEFGEVKVDSLSKKLSVPVKKNQFTLPNFDKDGVYSITYVAVDKAGNKSEPINDTYFRMVDTDVLAYISNSSLKDKTGYYSLMDETGKAISKKASDFKDLTISVIKLKNDKESGIVTLREDDQEYSPTDYTTSDDKDISETAMITETLLPATYFSETFRDDSLDTRMYLSVSIDKNAYLDLASIHIDNEPPTATTPEDFVSWHNYFFTKEATISLTNISETLNADLCKVYECPRNGDRTEIPFEYDKEKKMLSFVLKEGSHNIDITLVDEAGNEWNIDRVRYLRVGNFRLYVGIGIGLILLGAIIGAVLLRKKRES